LSTESYRQFSRAVDVGNQKYSQARMLILTKVPGYYLIDVDVARRSGILAIPRLAN
jgi:hypothetical protein